MMNLTQGINFGTNFQRRESATQTQRKEIKINLLAEARRVGDTAQIAILEGQLNDIDQQIDMLGQKKTSLKILFKMNKKYRKRNERR